MSGGKVVAWRIVWSPGEWFEQPEVTTDCSRVMDIRKLSNAPRIDDLVLQSDLAAAIARAEAAERDAARYRWLRGHVVEGRMESRGPRPDFYLNCDEPESEWDASIDRAIAAQQAEGE